MMKNSKAVTHKLWGSGTVTKLGENYITVRFRNFGTKTLAYPDCMESLLKFKDKSLQENAENDLREKHEKMREQELQRKIEIDLVIMSTKNKQLQAKLASMPLKMMLAEYGILSKYDFAKKALSKFALAWVLTKDNLADNPELLDIIAALDGTESDTDVHRMFAQSESVSQEISAAWDCLETVARGFRDPYCRNHIYPGKKSLVKDFRIVLKTPENSLTASEEDRRNLLLGDCYAFGIGTEVSLSKAMTYYLAYRACHIDQWRQDDLLTDRLQSLNARIEAMSIEKGTAA